MEEPIRILIADDHPIVRRGLRTLIASEPEMELVGEASDGEEAVSLARDVPYDVILLDLGMSNGDGFKLVSKLKPTRTASLPIIGIGSIEPDDALRHRPITISSQKGFPLSDVLNYLQAILSAVPPAPVERGTSVPPSLENRPG